jgi:hypothetical protein
MPPDSPMLTPETLDAAYAVGKGLLSDRLRAFLAAQDRDALSELAAHAIAEASGRTRLKQRPYVRREARAVIDELLGTPDAA